MPVELEEVVKKVGKEIILRSEDGKRVLGRFPFGEGEEYKDEATARAAAEEREKEVNKIKHAKQKEGELKEELSYGERERLVGAAFRQKFLPRGNNGVEMPYIPWSERPHIRETYEDFILVDLDSQKYRVGYTIDDQMNVTIDDRSDWKKAQLEVMTVEEETDESEEERSVLGEHIPLMFNPVETKLEEGMEADVIIIEPGLGNKKDKNFYSPKVIKENAHKFAGAKMYLSHDEKDRGVKSWVATITEAGKRFTPSGAAIGRIAVHKNDFWKDLKNLSEHGLLQTMHNSILALGKARPGIVGDIKANIVESIDKVKSVDFVPAAGAGGHVMQLIEEYQESGDIDFITLEELEDRRPDLVKEVKTKQVTLSEEYVAMTKTLEDVQKELKESQDKISEYEAELAEQHQVNQKRDAVTYLYKESEGKLPKLAVERIEATIGEGEFEEDADVEKIVDKLISDEVSYLSNLTKSGSAVTGMGESDEEEEEEMPEDENIEERNKAVDDVVSKFNPAFATFRENSKGA